MTNKLLLCTLLPMVVSAVWADDVVKGKIGFTFYPTIEEVADAYDNSDTNDLMSVAWDLVRSRNRERDRYSVANLAEVELQKLPGFEVICKVKVNDKGGYVTKVNEDDFDCRVFCSCKIGGRILSGTAHLEWDEFENAFSQFLFLKADYTSVVGRCVDTNGLPVADARVDVDVVTTPTEVGEKFYKTQVGRTDKDGRWIVEGVDKPAFSFALMRIANTNVVNHEHSGVPPCGIQVGAFVESEKGIAAAGGVTVPNVTARDRAAAERIFAAYKRKTGKDWPRPAPMTNFPVSTNNVIYVPDIVLR